MCASVTTLVSRRWDTHTLPPSGESTPWHKVGQAQGKYKVYSARGDTHNCGFFFIAAFSNTPSMSPVAAARSFGRSALPRGSLTAARHATTHASRPPCRPATVRLKVSSPVVQEPLGALTALWPLGPAPVRPRGCLSAPPTEVVSGPAPLAPAAGVPVLGLVLPAPPAAGGRETPLAVLPPPPVPAPAPALAEEALGPGPNPSTRSVAEGGDTAGSAAPPCRIVRSRSFCCARARTSAALCARRADLPCRSAPDWALVAVALMKKAALRGHGWAHQAGTTGRHNATGRHVRWVQWAGMTGRHDATGRHIG